MSTLITQKEAQAITQHSFFPLARKTLGAFAKEHLSRIIEDDIIDTDKERYKALGITAPTPQEIKEAVFDVHHSLEAIEKYAQNSIYVPDIELYEESGLLQHRFLTDTYFQQNYASLLNDQVSYLSYTPFDSVEHRNEFCYPWNLNKENIQENLALAQKYKNGYFKIELDFVKTHVLKEMDAMTRTPTVSAPNLMP